LLWGNPERWQISATWGGQHLLLVKLRATWRSQEITHSPNETRRNTKYQCCYKWLILLDFRVDLFRFQAADWIVSCLAVILKPPPSLHNSCSKCWFILHQNGLNCSALTNVGPLKHTEAIQVPPHDIWCCWLSFLVSLMIYICIALYSIMRCLFFTANLFVRSSSHLDVPGPGQYIGCPAVPCWVLCPLIKRIEETKPCWEDR
jgi:hypothetical protein